MEAAKHTIVSAPGKVLLAGGYLVLDRKYTGLVVATSSRFYCSVRPRAAGDSTLTGASSSRVSVRAGQFPLDASVWGFDVSVAEGEVVLSPATEGAGKNKFVAMTLAKTLQFALESLAAEGSQDAGAELLGLLGADLDVVVLADNDFYSQREQLAAAGLPARYASLAQLAPFCQLPRPISSTNKTGLGSSAALVTSLVAGLLTHVGLADLTTPKGRDTIHALAQAAHCLAQGKVGSGFDVASAVYGTHVYRRFSPEVLEPLFKENESSCPSVRDVVLSDKWDQETADVRLPRGLRLMLADVDAGTDTPSFVGKVLAWRKAEPEQALMLWTHLDTANCELRKALDELVQLESDPKYDEVLAAAAKARIEDVEVKGSDIPGVLQRIQLAIQAVRNGMRSMSLASDVPIEPMEQTELLDACSDVPGVLGGGVPGAGGYDAVWVLAVDEPEVVDTVEGVWSRWTDMSVSPLSALQSDGGLQLETAAGVRGLAEALAR